MKAQLIISNARLFSRKVKDINLKGLTGTDHHNGILGNVCFTGNLSIRTRAGGWKDITGEHGSRDYESEYGFILECNDH
ncbi:MAG: hypothetical protein PHD25_05440 [Bacteroidales bacterium]|nr:hypothetical protein [Bacteroidales bacterium]